MKRSMNWDVNLKRNKILFLGILISVTALIFSNCASSKYVQPDTSYTVESSYQKLKKEYPDIVALGTMNSSEVKSQFNVPYARLSPTRQLFTDIFYPKKIKHSTYPAIIMIHGGGWISGSKENLTAMGQHLSAEGYVVLVIEYRLGGEAPYPAAIYDIKRAISWTKENAEKLNINPNQIALLGSSAGAHLATLVGTTPDHPVFINDDTNSNFSTNVQAIVNVDGIVSFIHPEAEPEWTGKSANAWLGDYETNRPKWKEASPLEYISSETPPTLFINSSRPRFHAGRDNYLEVLSKHQIYYDVLEFENCPHGFWLFDPWAIPTIQKTNEFLKMIFDKM